MVVVRFLTPSLQAGDSGSYLASLAAQLSLEMGTTYHAVLQQLEDLRLAEWADQAPPPPSHPGHRTCHSTSSSPHTYANYPAAPEERQQRQYSDTDPIYQPGQYAVSSSLPPPWYAPKSADLVFCTRPSRGRAHPAP